MAYGYEGLGLFYTVLEKFAKAEKPINTIALKHSLKVGKRLNKCWNFMESLGIICSSNGETFSKELLNFSEMYTIKKEKNKERIKQWREKQQDTKNVTHNEHVRNTPKVNISKVNINKDNINIADEPPKVKSSDFKKEKKPVTETSLHSTCKNFFLDQAKISGKICYWQGREGKSLNQIIDKIKFSIKEHSGLEPTETEISEAFKVIITKLPDWQKEKGYDINTINSGFNRITNEIKSTNSKTGVKTNYADITEMLRGKGR